MVAGSTLTINQASLTATVDNQTKVYGADDPTLSGIGVTLAGLIDRNDIYTWNNPTVTIDDSALTSNATALTRAAGENVWC